MAKALPTWRKIESTLIELLREREFTIEQQRGVSFIEVTHNGYQIEVDLEDFAKELEQRL